MRTIKYLLAIGLIGTVVGCAGNIVVKMPQTTDAGQTELLADVKVMDLRQPGVASSKREAAFGVPMGTVEFDPPAAQFIKQELETELTKLLTDKGIELKRYYVADLMEFGVNTDTTPLYWDVIGRIHLLVNEGENQHDLFGTHTIRTYVWPGEEIIQKVISESMKQIISGLKPVSAGGMDKPYADKSASTASKPTPVDKVRSRTSLDINSASQFVAIDQGEPAFIVFTGIPKNLDEKRLEEIKLMVSSQKKLTLLTWQQFLERVDEYARSVILKNDYPNISIVDGLVCLVASKKGTGAPWGLTWNGGIALTRNDYQHARQTYETYKENPASYKPIRDPRADPVNPGGHLPFAGCIADTTDIKVTKEGEKVVNAMIIQTRNGLFYEVNHEEPFTGTLVVYHPNGQKALETKVKDGLQHGLARGWYQNGQIKVKGTAKDGKQHGITTEWYENGQNKSEVTYKDGNRVTGTEWDENGNVIK